MPKVSVILTSFNHAKYLREAIDSALNQTFTDFELIIWDDASSDDSWEIIQSYEDPRIKAFRNDVQRRGIYGINKAISEVAQGEYIAIHHSDDVWEPEKLEKQVAFLDSHADIGAVFTNALAIDEDSAPFKDEGHFYFKIFDQPNRSRHEWLRHFFERGNALCHPSVLIRKQCYKDCGLYRYGFGQLGDFDMWVRLALQCEIYVLPEKLVRFRVRENEANTSGSRPETRSRHLYEYSLILNHHLQINTLDDLVKVFPEALKFCSGDNPNLRYALAMTILEIQPFYFTIQFALNLLFEILNDPAQRNFVAFDNKDFIKLTGELDPLQVQRWEKLNEAVTERDGQIAHLDQALGERDRQIGSLNQAVDERDGQIASLSQAVAERDGQIASLSQAVIERDSVINALRSSTSWRLTKSLRWCGSQVLRGKLLLRALALANTHTGDAKKMLIKLVNVYKREGLQGVRSRVRFLLERASFQHSIRGTSAFNVSDQDLANRNKEVVRHHQSVDVIVCVHNALDDVKRCLESVMCNTYPPYHLIIVDDGSGQETKDYLEKFIVGQPAVLIRNNEAAGYTKAANSGMRASTGGFIVLLNSDTIVPPRWLDRLVMCANSSDQIGMVGPLSNTASWQSVPKIMNASGDWADNPLPTGWSVNDYANEVARVSPMIYPRVGFLNGFCLLIKRQLIEDIGLFDEETFARGYGEENDYCLRTTENNWQLAVADDCYVFHAQSKSYFHERRAELARLAGEALAKKHGQFRIDHNLSMTEPHLALHYMRQRCTEIEEISSLHAEAHWRFEGKRVLFLLPARSAGGGGNIVLLEAACMRALGVDAWIANLEMHRPLFEQSHPDVQVPVLYLQSPEDLLKVGLDFDAVIATLYLTVFWMDSLRKLDRCPTLGYYIQDFEPDFFDEGSTNYQAALLSYTAIPDLRLFTKTNWNQQTLHNKLGVLASVIGGSLDIDKFHPSSIIRTEVGVVKILAMVRPSTPRRAPAATMRVLKRLAQHFGARIHIMIFGGNPQDPEFLTYSTDFAHKNLGEIDAQGMATALSDADIFVDCSIFQAMGLTAMEAMASGVAVVGPVNGGLKEIIVDRHNGILVDTQHEDKIFSAVAQLISDNELRTRIQKNALEVLTHSPVFSSFKILDCLFPQTHQAIDKQYPQERLHDTY